MEYKHNKDNKTDILLLLTALYGPLTVQGGPRERAFSGHYSFHISVHFHPDIFFFLVCAPSVLGDLSCLLLLHAFTKNKFHFIF